MIHLEKDCRFRLINVQIRISVYHEQRRPGKALSQAQPVPPTMETPIRQAKSFNYHVHHSMATIGDRGPWRA